MSGLPKGIFIYIQVTIVHNKTFNERVSFLLIVNRVPFFWYSSAFNFYLTRVVSI